MANPFPFTANAILTAAELNAIGEITSFTPTWTNYTRGNGTTNSVYVQINGLVYCAVREVLGSTSSVTGVLRLTLPVTANDAAGIQPGSAQLTDAGTAVYLGRVFPINTTTVDIRAINAAATYATVVATSATVPFTWTNGDFFEAAFVYEAA